MEKIEYARGDQRDEEARRRRNGGGVPLQRVPERVDNTTEVDDAARERLIERIIDPERDLIDAPRSHSYEFASRFSEEFEHLR